MDVTTMESVRYMHGEEKATRVAGDAGAQDEVRALVEKAAAGSVEAFGEVYSMYLDRIYRYIYYQVHNKETAEDLTEEVFIKAWRKIGKFRWEGRPFSAWLYRIAHNHVVDYFRTNRRHEPLDIDIPTDQDQPEGEYEQKQLQQMILRALSSLPQQQRQIITLKFIEDSSNETIGQVTGKSQGAIRVMQMRALGALRRRLKEEMAQC
jgi:RNA polymerase sigma-70 factor (ECF subfamily)